MWNKFFIFSPDWQKLSRGPEGRPLQQSIQIILQKFVDLYVSLSLAAFKHLVSGSNLRSCGLSQHLPCQIVLNLLEIRVLLLSSFLLHFPPPFTSINFDEKRGWAFQSFIDFELIKSHWEIFSYLDGPTVHLKGKLKLCSLNIKMSLIYMILE